MTDKKALKVLQSWLQIAYHNADGTDDDSAELYEALQTTFSLINRQKVEIERLQKKVNYLKNVNKRNDVHLHVRLVEQAKSEAIKEFSNELIKTLKYALYGLDIKEKTISKEEVQKRFELLMHKDIPEVIEYVKNKMVGDEK